MADTIGYHVVISGFGLWLPGDARGSWSTAWDEKIGLIEPHTLHPGDPVRLRMSNERLKDVPVRLSDDMVGVVIDSLADCSAESKWSFVSASVETTHMHMLLTYMDRNVDNTIKWIKDRTTKQIHRQTSHRGSVWCKGKWRRFVFDLDVLERTRNYIEQHNVRRGVGPRPYPFFEPDAIP